jgi:hypothetical protein
VSPPLKAHGIAVELPHGWEGRIYRRHGGDPTLHAASFALPHDDGDFGSVATARMPAGGGFLSLTEYRPGRGLAPGRGLFESTEIPLPLDPRNFDPRTLHIGRSGQAGFQHFFTAGGRPFCLYAVISTKPLRQMAGAKAKAAAIDEVNSVLTSVTIG